MSQTEAAVSREPLYLIAAVLVILAISGIDPVADRYTWFLETLPVMIAVPILIVTRVRFPLTLLTYRLLAVHAVILMIGAYYTYAQVPAFDWLRDAFDLSRNHYDRVGHFAQGFVPAILLREILLRCTPLKRGAWLFVIVLSMCLAFSAFYELIEWWVALLNEQAAEAFLGTQGDPWDTQADMFLAMIGAITAQLFLRGEHDRQLRSLLND